MPVFYSRWRDHQYWQRFCEVDFQPVSEKGPQTLVPVIPVKGAKPLIVDTEWILDTNINIKLLGYDLKTS